MRKTILLFMVCAVCSPAESNFHAPLVAVARDDLKQLRMVYGLAGNFILKDAIAKDVLIWTFSGSGGLVQTRSALLLLDTNGRITRSIKVPEGPMLLASGTASVPALYFSSANFQLRQVRAETDQQVTLDPDALAGNVVALRAVSRSRAEVAVCRDSDLCLLTVKLSDGSVEREIAIGGATGAAACGPAKTAAVLLMNGSVIVADAKDLIIQSAGGIERRVKLNRHGKSDGAFQIRQAGDGWIAVDSERQSSWLIRITGAGEGIYRLPNVEVKQ
jgi:hypothetical protein